MCSEQDNKYLIKCIIIAPNFQGLKDQTITFTKISAMLWVQCIQNHENIIVKKTFHEMYSASSLVFPLLGIVTFIGISSCRRGCVWVTKFRFSVFVCLSLTFLETWFGWDARIVICSQSMQLKYLTCKSVRAGKSKGS